MPYSRATIDVWDIALPTSLTTPAAIRNNGVHAGVVRGVTRISPGFRRRTASTKSRMTRTGPVATPGLAGAPCNRASERVLAPKAERLFVIRARTSHEKVPAERGAISRAAPSRAIRRCVTWACSAAPAETAPSISDRFRK